MGSKNARDLVRKLLIAGGLGLAAGWGWAVPARFSGAEAAAPAGPEAAQAVAAAFAAGVLKGPADQIVLGSEATGTSMALGGTVRHYKFMEQVTGRLSGVTVRGDGKPIDVAEFDRLEHAANRARYGKLHPQVMNALQVAAPSDAIEVGIWLDDIGYEPPAKPRAGSGLQAGRAMRPQEVESLLKEAQARRRAFVTSLTSRVLGRLKAMDPGAVADDLTPSVTAKLTRGQIQNVATWADVSLVASISKPTEQLANAKYVTGYIIAQQTYGFSGTGVQIAQVELGGPIATANPNLSVVQAWNGTCDATHATGVAGVLRSTDAGDIGAAPAATLWAGGRCTNSWTQVRAESGDAVTWGAKTINLSWGGDSGGSVNEVTKYYDDVVINQYRGVVAAAGNNGGDTDWVNEVPSGYNLTGVGNFDDGNTSTWSDDTMNPSSSWRDPLSTHGDREKPDIAAPGTDIFTTTTASPWFEDRSGTSFAAPMVTGTTALMIQAASDLAIWPEAVRALLMATAIHNIEGSARLSESDGAGGLHSQYAVDAARGSSGGWYAQGVDCSPGDVDVVVWLPGGKATRVVLAFDSNPSFSDYINRPSADLDLQVISPGGSILSSSTSYDNTYEIVTTNTTTSGNYTFRTLKYRCDVTPRWMAVAWFQQ